MRIPIVNEQDEIIGYKNNKDRNSEDICRIAGLWLTDNEGNILLAQRAFTKRFSPGLWGPAVAGTVEEGETYESNIIKEAEEEIGLTGFEFILGPKDKRSSSHKYFIQWFTIVVDHNYPFKKQDTEVEEIKWFSRKEISELLEKNPNVFAPSFKESFNYFSNETQSKKT